MKATLSLLTKATLSLWLISSLPAFAATEKISALLVTTLLASNDFLVVNIWNGSAFVTKTIAFTNLPIGLNLQNATNLSAFGLDNTNWLRTLIADLPRGTNYGYNLLDPVRSKFRDPTRQFRLLTEGTSLVVGASGSDGIYSSVRFRTLG